MQSNKENYAGTRNCNGLFNRAGDNADCRMSATIGTLLLLWLVLKINIDIIMWVVFLELVLFIGLGVVRIQGLTVLRFIASNPTKKRPFDSKGVFSDVDNR